MFFASHWCLISVPVESGKERVEWAPRLESLEEAVNDRSQQPDPTAP